MFQATITTMQQDPVGSLDRDALVGRIEELRLLRSAVSAYEARVVRAIDALDDDGLDGRGVLRSAGRMAGKTAHRAASIAHALTDLPQVAASLEAGRITAEHAASLVRAAEEIDPQSVDAELVGLAESGPADIAAKRIREWVTERTKNDPKPTLDEQHRLRTFRRWDDKTTGLAMFLFGIDQTQAAAADARLNRRERQLYDADGGRDGAPDLIRTTEQRYADAFIELLTAPDRASSTPPHPKYSLAATFDVRGLTMNDGTPVASLVRDGMPLPREVIDRLACESSIVPILFDGPANPIWVGRDHRTATIAQWKALIARDRGCVGCGAAPERCHAHHVQYWDNNGPTDIDNLALLCTRCHHNVHDRGHTLTREHGRWIIRPPDPRTNAKPKTCDFPAEPETEHLTPAA